MHDAEDRQIVGLGAAARENDLLRLGVEKLRHLPARALDTGARVLSEGVNAGRVAVVVFEIRQHGPQRPWSDGSRRVVVEIVAFHGVTVRVLIISWGLKS